MILRLLFRYGLLFLPLLFLIACNTAGSETGQRAIDGFPVWLLFKKERLLEIRESGTSAPLLIPLDIEQNLPIGEFELIDVSAEGLCRFEFPNAYYATKYHSKSPDFSSDTLNTQQYSFQLNDMDKMPLPDPVKVYIFPNDSRAGGNFEACTDCPYWITELYSFLELQLSTFPIPSTQ